MISINRAALLVNAHPLRRRAQGRYQRVPAVRLPRSPATPWGYDREGVVMKVALIQMNSQDDKAANLKAVEALVGAAVADARPDLVALPEMFPYLAMDDDGRRRAAETVPDGEALALLGDLAVRHGTTIHGGSILEADGNRMFNTTFVVDPEGRRIARYRKIHMFDVTTPDGMEYWESETFSRGEEVVSYAIDGITVGCSVCYDLRFPELYQALAKKGASVIVVPAAFTMQTGKDHWETLLRARAIETQCYVLAPAQWGRFANGTRTSWGHSMVVDPWGHIVAQSHDKVGFVTATLDFDYLESVRAAIPVADHKIL